MQRATKVGLIFGLGAAVLGIVLPSASLLSSLRPASPKKALALQLDASGPYAILTTTRVETAYAGAIEKALALHPGAERVAFEPDNLQAVLEVLRRIQPRYALVFISPEELDV